MKELKNKSYKECPDWDTMLDRFNGKGNIVPHEGTVSKNRGAMWSSASTQYRPIEFGETPLVDTKYSYDILKSTKNVFAKNNMKRIASFDKTVGGRYSGITSHILQDEDGRYHLVTYKSYEETGAGYGVKMIDDISNYEIGETIEKGESIIRTNSYGDDMEYKWGVNATTVLSIDVKSVEDAGLISEGLANKFAGWAYTDIEEILDINNDALKNIYGDYEDYKPFPLIGEEIQGDIVMAISKNQRNHQFIKTGYGIDSVNKTDTKIFGKGTIVDITVRQKYGETCQNSYLSALINENRKYELALFEFMKKLIVENDKFTEDFMDMYYKLRAFYEKDAGFKYKKILSNQAIVINLTVINKEVPTSGQKITGRCGNKFTVVDTFEDGKYYTKEYGNIEYMGNCLALFNRAIMEVPIEMYQTHLSMLFDRLIKERQLEDSELKRIILGTLYIMDKDMYKAYSNIFENYWEEFKEEPMIYWYQSTYHSGTTIKTCYEARNFLKENGIEVKRVDVYMKTEYGDKKIGSAMVAKIFITPLKQIADSQLSIRAKGSYDTRGIILRTRDGRIRNTPVRKSALVGDIQANSLHPDDLKYINSMSSQESIQYVNALLVAMGVEIVNPHL